MAAIVTGSATGIGRAIAIAFGEQGGKGIAVQTDVTKPDEMARLVTQTQEAFGPLRIMVNNAGIEEKHPFLETPLELYRRIIEVNLTGVWIGAQTAARAMVAHGKGGRIVNISSIHEDVAMPTNAAYCASKGGVRMLARTIAVELAQHDITVNNVCPGAIQTPMDVAVEKNPQQDRALLDEIPLRRMGKPEEVAELCVYLASPAAAYVTGASFVIDGGMMQQSGSL